MSILNTGDLFGDKDLSQLMSRIDKISSDFNLSSTEQEEELASKAIEEYISSMQLDDKETPIGHLLQSISVPTERISRYKLYDEIFNMIPIIKRIVRVYINNTIQKDVLNSETFIITNAQKNDENESYKQLVKNIIEHFQLDKKLKNLVLQKLLRHGDFFIEIVDLKEDVSNLPDASSLQTADKNQMAAKFLTDSHSEYVSLNKDIEFLEENQKLRNGNQHRQDENQIDQIANTFVKHFVDISEGIHDKDLYQNYLLFEDTNPSNKSNMSLSAVSKKDLNRFMIKYHDTSKMVILETKNQNMRLGYILVETREQKEVYPGISARFASVIHHTKKHGDKSSGSESQRELVNRIIGQMVKKIVSKTSITKKANTDSDQMDPKKRKEIQKAYEDQLHNALGDDVFYLVKQLYDEIGKSNKHSVHLKRVNIRFIPCNKIVHFCLDPVEHYPYGTGKLDSLTYTAKLYLLTQLSNIVTKLSRAAIMRKWTVETGPRDQNTNLIQKLKRQLRNQKVSVDDIVSVKSIPKILSDFKDMIVLSKKGQRYIDVETQQTGDPNVKVQDLKDLREELIALSGVPAPYLGYHDVVDLREQLVNINVTFATEIISIQDVANEGIQELVQKICKGFDDTKNIDEILTIKLRPPTALILQFLEGMMSSISNIQQSLMASRIQGNPYYLLKKFVPSIDWDQYSEESEQFNLFKKAKGESDEQQGGGGMY